jgi:hypothetical protein
MTGSAALDRFLKTDRVDVGCDEAMALLHIYADLLSTRTDAKARYPGVTAHLQACGPCCKDFDGLLAAISSEER